MVAANTNRKSRARAEAAGRSHDPEGVRRDILAVATEEFADNGLSGARVDEIAARTQTSKRMIYYYFGDKEGLFVAVLEAAYGRIRAIETDLDLAGMEPAAALRTLTEFTFSYQNDNPDFVRLVMVENIHKGVHLARSEKIQAVNVSVLAVLRDIYQRGVATGAFKAGLDVIDIHMTISALAFFNVSNRATFSLIFKRDMASRAALARRRKAVADTVMGFVRPD